MSTDHMPNPPDAPTLEAPAGNPQTQDAVPGESTAPAAPPPPFDLGADMASIIHASADILAQRLVYHNQIMYGVGAVAIDIVNARTAVLVLANALRNHTVVQGEQTLINMGDSPLVQINDGTLPFKNNVLVAGLFEGLIVDAISHAYADDPARAREARTLLDNIFQPANEQMQSIYRLMSHIPQPGPGAPAFSLEKT